MANPFSVNVPNALEALMAGESGYKGVRDIQNQRALAEAGQLYAAGDIRGAQAAAARGGSLQALMGFSGLQNQERDFQLRQQEIQRTQGNADRSFGEQQRQFNVGAEGTRIPPGFRQGPDGLIPTPGGPADPKYLQSVADAKDKGRQMSITDITKLTEEGQKFSDLTRFSDTFKPEYAGYASTKVGNVANIAGRHLPESIVGKTMAEGSTWWQGYDKYKNVVRHELYGSALTAPETAAFERADITPGMTPEQVTKNLALQKDIVENGLKRKANAMISAGYDPKTISSAYGVQLPSIGVDATGRRGGITPAAGVAPPAETSVRKQAPPEIIQEAKAAIAQGADKAAIRKRLVEQGYNPAGI